MNPVKNTCASCASYAELTSAESGCCVTGVLKAKLENLAAARSASEKVALQQQIDAEHAKIALIKSEERVRVLSTQNEELRVQIEALRSKLRDAEQSQKKNEVEVAAEEAANAIAGMDFQESSAKPEVTASPCVLVYSDRGFRKLKLQHPDLDLYTEFAGLTVFGRFSCRADMDTAKIVAETNSFLADHRQTEIHLLCHSGVNDLIKHSQSGSGVDETAKLIIAPLAALKNHPRVLSISWCTMIEGESARNVAAVNEKILASDEVKSLTVTAIDLRLISGDTRNVIILDPQDPSAIRYNHIGLKIIFNRLKRLINETMSFREVDLKRLEKQRDEFKASIKQKAEASKQRADLVAKKKQVLAEAIAKAAEKQPCPECKAREEGKIPKSSPKPNVTPPNSRRNVRTRSPRKSGERPAKRFRKRLDHSQQRAPERHQPEPSTSRDDDRPSTSQPAPPTIASTASSGKLPTKKPIQKPDPKYRWTRDQAQNPTSSSASTARRDGGSVAAREPQKDNNRG